MGPSYSKGASLMKPVSSTLKSCVASETIRGMHLSFPCDDFHLTSPRTRRAKRAFNTPCPQGDL